MTTFNGGRPSPDHEGRRACDRPRPNPPWSRRSVRRIWWAWICYTWLTNTSAESGNPARTLIFLAMSAMLVASSSPVEAFDGEQ
jgi:hypothetical protein